MDNIKIHIIYSIETEVTRIKNTFRKVDWFKEKGYWNKIKLPKSLRNLESLEQVKKSDVLDAVSNEYNEEEYRQFAKATEISWNAVCEKFFQP